jgi:uroporphyrinogen decarboxylase
MPGASVYEFIEEQGLDAICVQEDIPWVPVTATAKLDQFGVLRDNRAMPGLHWPIALKGPLEDLSNLDGYVPPDPDDPSRVAPVREAAARFKGKKAIIYVVVNSYLPVTFLRGMENLLSDYVTNPELAQHLTDICSDYYGRLALRAIEAGADIILEGDDYCGKTGPMMSPRHFRKFILPGIKAMVDGVHAAGGLFLKHSDGFLWPILDDLVNTGIDALNPIEPAARMDIGEVKRKYGDRVCVVGNIDCAELLTFGTPAEVRAAVRECIHVASPGYGHIICSSNVVHEGVPAENYKAMLEAAREFGNYPITA